MCIRDRLPEYVEEINDEEVIFRNYVGERYVYKQPRQMVPVESACGVAAQSNPDIVPIGIANGAKRRRVRAKKSARG